MRESLLAANQSWQQRTFFLWSSNQLRQQILEQHDGWNATGDADDGEYRARRSDGPCVRRQRRHEPIRKRAVKKVVEYAVQTEKDQRVSSEEHERPLYA